VTFVSRGARVAWAALACVAGALAPSMAAAIDDPGRDFGLATLRERLQLSARLRYQGAINTRNAHFQKSELVFEPELDARLPWDLALTAIGRLRYDPFDRIEPGSPPQPEVSTLSRRGFIGDEVDVELREFYVEGALGRTLFTVGKQQIVWGQADGLKVLDVVNPQDFREFILPEFSHSRIPLWAVNAEVPLGGVTGQIVWIPDQTYHVLPERDGVFAFTSPRIVPPTPPGVPVQELDFDRPKRVVADSDVGLRLSSFLAGWDLTLNYLYHYDDTPVFFQDRTSTPIPVRPEYERTHLVGGSFSNAFGDLTVRGEIGYWTRRFFSTADEGDVDGVKKTGEFSYVLGFDWYGFSDTFLSAQIFQSILGSHGSGLVRDRVDTNLTLVARRHFLHERLRLEGIWVHNANDGDGFVRPKVGYEFRDDVAGWVGFDVFYGTSRGVFGEFGTRDRFVFGLEWSR
jgi:hypothetical protein